MAIAAAVSLAVPLVVSSAVIGAKAAPAIVNAGKKIINFSAQAGKVVVQSSKKVANSANDFYQASKNLWRGTTYAHVNSVNLDKNNLLFSTSAKMDCAPAGYLEGQLYPADKLP